MNNSVWTEPELQPMRRSATADSIVVVGGGIAGLSASVRLAMLGYAVTLIEARPIIGGMLVGDPNIESQTSQDVNPHMIFGNSTHLIDFYQHLGISDQIDWINQLGFCFGGGKFDVMQADDLPAPMHLSRSVMSFSFLTMTEKMMIARAMLKLVRLGKEGREKQTRKTFFQWLAENHQPLPLIEKFWSPLIKSTMYASLDRVEATYAIQLFQDGFLANEKAFRVGVPSVNWMQLYDQINKLIKSAGGQILLNQKVKSVEMQAGEISGVVLDDGQEIVADDFVFAVPPRELEKMCNGAMMRQDTRLRRLDRLKFNSILNMHFWFEPSGVGLELPSRHMLFSNTPLQWLYDKGYDISQGGQHLWGLSYEAYDLMNESDADLIEMGLAQLTDALPQLKGRRLITSSVTRGYDATLVPLPGIDLLRPNVSGGISNMYLAGAWCNTNWPCNLEGAVRSGYMAVNALVKKRCGTKQVIVVNDLPKQSIYQMLAGREGSGQNN